MPASTESQKLLISECSKCPGLMTSEEPSVPREIRWWGWSSLVRGSPPNGVAWTASEAAERGRKLRARLGESTQKAQLPAARGLNSRQNSGRRQARRQACASRLGSQEPHRWWRLAGGRFRGRLPGVGAVTAHIGDRAGVRPQPCCSLAEASGQRSNGFRPPFVLASPTGSLQQWGAGDQKSSRCHP